VGVLHRVHRHTTHLGPAVALHRRLGNTAQEKRELSNRERNGQTRSAYAAGECVRVHRYIVRKLPGRAEAGTSGRERDRMRRVGTVCWYTEGTVRKQLGPCLEFVVVGASLEHGLVAAAAAGDLPHGGTAAAGDGLLGAGRQLDAREPRVRVVAHQDAGAYTRPLLSSS